MKKFLLSATALLAFPANAAILLPGTTAAFDPFPFATQGVRIAFAEGSQQALTFNATFRSAVYRNTLGTLDFYYQVDRLGVGSRATANNHAIERFTVGQFDNFSTFAYVATNNFDGTGGFKAANNALVGSGFTSTSNRNSSGTRIEVDFGANNLQSTENSATYIFRTNAFAFTEGTFGVLNASSIQGFTFAPTVPEPATWAMMIGGFGLLGAASRRSVRSKSVLA